MALVTTRVSDISGKSGKEADFVTVVVRELDDLEKPLQFDALGSEVAGLQSAANLVVLELKNGTDETRRVIVTREQFDSLGNMEQVLANARNVRGREPHRSR